MAWTDEEKNSVIDALAVACEVTSTMLSPAAQMFMLGELERHPAAKAVGAIKQAARQCTGRITLAHVVKALEFVDRKALSDAQAVRLHDETILRNLALVERIPWESGVVEVRRQLEAKGYSHLPSPLPEKQIRNLPHWQDEEKPE